VLRAPVHAGFTLCALSLASILISTGCAHHTPAKIPPSARATPPPAKIGSTETGMASWYGKPYDGRRAASGEIYDMQQLTAAHRSLPFQTWVEVTDLDNGKKVIVRITDRGPFVDGRIIDLSLAAAREIEMVGPGTARVRLKVVPPPEKIPERVAIARADPPLPATPPPKEPRIEKQMEPEKSPANDPLRREVYAVQAAAFADRDRAEAYSNTLRARFADLTNESRVVSSPPVWKVLLGRELSLDAANDLAARLKDSGATALVVRDF